MSEELRDTTPAKNLFKQPRRLRVGRAFVGVQGLHVRQSPTMRAYRVPLFALPVALAVWACRSEPTSTEPSETPSLARAAKAYTPVDLEMLGGTESQATDIAPPGR